ncbi:MAG: signal peptidase I [Clostridiales bacterium]|jgi:signal peptidase I|nr:signal peptidase I [Clostridiales bacterium]
MEEKEPNVKMVLLREAWGWIKTIVFALIFAWFFTRYILVNAHVPSGSMEQTIRTNDRIFAFRLSYLFSEPERYDIVVFRGRDEDTTLYVKRIIGIPGDVLRISRGRVYVNGQAESLRHDFVNGEDLRNFGPYPYQDDTTEILGVIPDGQYFVLGDNRTNSVDSRNWERRINPDGAVCLGCEHNPRCPRDAYYPFLDGERILGKAIFRYFPGFASLTN